MRKLLIILIMVSVFASINAGIFVDDSFFSKDKIDHFFTAMFLTTSSYYAAHAYSNDLSENKKMIFSVSISGGLSIFKEIYDGVSKTGHVSYKDLIYDFLGILAGILIVRLQ